MAVTFTHTQWRVHYTWRQHRVLFSLLYFGWVVIRREASERVRGMGRGSGWFSNSPLILLFYFRSLSLCTEVRPNCKILLYFSLFSPSQNAIFFLLLLLFVMEPTFDLFLLYFYPFFPSQNAIFFSLLLLFIVDPTFGRLSHLLNSSPPPPPLLPPLRLAQLANHRANCNVFWLVWRRRAIQ